MGNSFDRKATKLKNKLFSSEQHPNAPPTIGFDFECPNCAKHYPPKTTQTEVTPSPSRYKHMSPPVSR